MNLLGLTERTPRRWARPERRQGLCLGMIALLVAVAIAGCARPAGRIELSQTKSDWGTVSNKAAVSRAFEVRNVGQGLLEITGVSTSCGCTIAEVSDRQLTPGETAALKVTYDPQVHQGATGEFLRMVYIRSDDPDTPEAALAIRVRVVER